MDGDKTGHSHAFRDDTLTSEGEMMMSVPKIIMLRGVDASCCASEKEARRCI